MPTFALAWPGMVCFDYHPHPKSRSSHFPPTLPLLFPSSVKHPDGFRVKTAISTLQVIGNSSLRLSQFHGSYSERGCISDSSSMGSRISTLKMQMRKNETVLHCTLKWTLLFLSATVWSFFAAERKKKGHGGWFSVIIAREGRWEVKGGDSVLFCFTSLVK